MTREEITESPFPSPYVSPCATVRGRGRRDIGIIIIMCRKSLTQ